MNIKMIVVLSAALTLGITQAHAEGDRDPLAAIREGQLVLSDGSSIYIFNKDKSFKSAPLGLSGRAIKGTWQAIDSNRFQVKGTWNWING